MRVIEPKYNFKRKKVYPLYKHIFIFFTLLAAGLSLGIYYYKIAAKPENVPDKPSINKNVKQDMPKTLKSFTAQQFNDLFNNLAHPNTQKINEVSSITDSEIVDQRIKDIAESRGYMIQSAPVTDTFVVIDKNVVLQQKAAAGWIELKNLAAKDGIHLLVSEGYRSEADQKKIFLERLGKIDPADVENGSKDKHIDSVLTLTAPPGYSRHHSGYTIDLVCESQKNTRFLNSVCYAWLQNDNYKNAKVAGWMPSYPEGATMQGPDPEAWEYVWAGKQAFY